MRYVILLALSFSLGLVKADELPFDTNAIKSLTIEQARVFVQSHPYQRSLDGLETLSPEVAKVLISEPGVLSAYYRQIPWGSKTPESDCLLSLNGLEVLSEAAAEVLAAYPSELRLDGIKTIPAGTLASLVSGSAVEHSFFSGSPRWKKLRLSGLSTLSINEAALLASYKGDALYLNGLSELSPETLKALAAYRGSLYLDGLVSLTQETTRSLLGHFGGGLHLGGLKDLPIEVAAILADSDRNLYLDGLKDVAPEVVTALFYQPNVIGWTKGVSFGGLKKVSDELAETLATLRNANFSLHGLEELTNTNLAEKLYRQERQRLSHYTPDDSYDNMDVHRAQPTHGTFASLKTLTPDVAEFLCSEEHPLKVLDLRSLEDLTPQTASILGSFDGSVFFFFDGGSDQMCELLLDGLQTISDEALGAMVDAAKKRHFGTFSLNKLNALSPTTASLMRQIEADNLCLNGLRKLSAQSAKELAKSRASSIRLNGLTHLSAEAARELLAFPRSIQLNGLKVIDVDVARALATTNCKSVGLGGITALPDEVEKELASSLNGITERNKGEKYQVSRIELEKLDEVKTATLAKALAFTKKAAYGRHAEFAPDVHRRLEVDASIMSPEAAKGMAGEKWPDEFALRLHPLTPQLAKIFVASDKSLTIHCDDLGDDVAAVLAVLATHKNDLSLFGLPSLSVEVAKLLQPHRHHLTIEIPVTCEQGALEELAEHEGKLTVFGLRSLQSNRLAKKLLDSTDSEDGHWLDLRRLEEISPEVADALGEYRGPLELPGLTSLTSKSLAQKLASQETISLNKLTKMSDDAADALVKFEGDLDLLELRSLTSELLAEKFASEGWDGLNIGDLKEISPEVAGVLAREEHLGLNGLAEITPEVAEAVAKCEGDLYLEGLASLGPAAARALATHKGDLYLNGLTKISPEVAESLAGLEGNYLDISSLTAITPEVAEVLANFEGELRLDGLTAITLEVAKALKGEYLQIDHLSTITPEIAVALTKWRSLPNLDNLDTITPEIAAALSNSEDALHLNGVTCITPEAAEALAKCKGDLLLNGLIAITPEIAENLAKCKGGLSLEGLAFVTPEVADALVKHDGPDLSLGGIMSDDVETTQALKKYQHNLELSIMKGALTPEVVKELVAFRAKSLRLRSCVQQPLAIAESLDENKSILRLSGFR